LCILSLSPIARDARVLRQIEAACTDFEVAVVGWGELDRERPHVTMHPVARVTLPAPSRLVQAALMLLGRLWPGAFERWYWRKPDHEAALREVIAARPALIHCNEAIALPIAVRAARETGARWLFDAHEFSPEQFGDRRALRLLARPLYRYLLARYAPRAEAMTTVCQGIAERYASDFGLRAVVVRNVPHYHEMPFRPTKANRIRLIHHGVAKSSRGLDRLIDTVARLDEVFELELMLLDSGDGTLAALRAQAATDAPGRVRFREPVPPAEIAATIHAADIGVYLLPPLDFNHAMALPNKLFDFLMAGLAVAIGPSPEMARVVRAAGCGIVAPSFEPADLAAALAALSAAEIDRMKRAALDAARELNAEREMARLLELYHALLAREDSE
jgi:glycosyltransferase involved in cell wall biosynthesis